VDFCLFHGAVQHIEDALALVCRHLGCGEDDAVLGHQLGLIGIRGDAGAGAVFAATRFALCFFSIFHTTVGITHASSPYFILMRSSFSSMVCDKRSIKVTVAAAWTRSKGIPCK